MEDNKVIIEQELRNIYYYPTVGYQSAEKLYQKAKEKGVSVSGRLVREWLKTQDTYTRHTNLLSENINFKKRCKRSCRSNTTRSGGHGQIQKQKQRVLLDTNGR